MELIFDMLQKIPENENNKFYFSLAILATTYLIGHLIENGYRLELNNKFVLEPLGYQRRPS